MPNRLSHETSPYLHQHADNPVDWYAWGDEALGKARAEGKPILLSIGYSACHWCHVMAHESFEDAETAAMMNALYVNIKVDREERPDLDKIYQLAHQVLTQRGGGWPLTLFLAPNDLLPFYAGTYFPREPRYNMPTFKQVLQQVREWFDNRRDDVNKQNTALQDFLLDHGKHAPTDSALTRAPIDKALRLIEARMDPVYGGHSGAPKFPHVPELELLLACADESEPEPRARMRGRVQLTLTCMANGGIHDQLGGGFCRYSVDERWEIPHFEKMLYDNALLLPLLAHVAHYDDDELYAAASGSLVKWLTREMRHRRGAFYSALDADSEGEEGRFYVWQREQVKRLLSEEEFAVAERRWGLDKPPNFEHSAWNLIAAEPLEEIARLLDRTRAECEALLASAQSKLFAERGTRVRPGCDDKVLTAWNALTVAGMARASRWQSTPTLQALACEALDFIHAELWRDGRLLACWKDGQARFRAYLDDYAFLLNALLETLQCRWSARDIAWAIALADALLEHFEDHQNGGFYFTADDHETLIQRPKPWSDDATPSGNGIAARALLRLGHLLGEPRYLAAAERTLRASWVTLNEIPQSCTSLLTALRDFLQPRTQVIVHCAVNTQDDWRQVLGEATPNRADIFLIPHSADKLFGILEYQRQSRDDTAYLCNGPQCSAPIREPQVLGAALAALLNPHN